MVRVLFDITRLARRDPVAPPTGIDRVALAYGRWLTARTDIDLVPVVSVAGRLLATPSGVLPGLLEQACAVTNLLQADHATWRRLTACLVGAPVEPPLRTRAASDWPRKAGAFAGAVAQAIRAGVTPAPSGDVYLNVAHRGLEHPSLLASLRRGVRPVVMVHDLIPITHPQYCVGGAPERHRRRIDAILTSGATILANSRTTERSVLAYALSAGRGVPEIVLAQLGVESAFRRPPAPIQAAKPYFVAVGTIEPRKNLALLLRIWTRLAEALGEGAPRLVSVGRRGWEKRAVLDAFDRSPVARRLILEAGDLPDPALASLVAGAAALLAPSNVEGYDLPAVEALSLRTPVIASDIEAHRELALGAHLIATDDEAGWVRAIAAAAVQRPEPAPFAAPSWRAHFETVSDAMGLRRRSFADDE